jgi:hypothetical protein
MITEDFWVYVGRLTEAAAREMFRLGHRPVL